MRQTSWLNTKRSQRSELVFGVQFPAFGSRSETITVYGAR